jgi:hypothetical protein
VCTVDSTPELDVFSTSLGRSVIRGRVPEATVRLREVPSANLYQPPPQPAPLSQATLWDMAVIEGGAAVGGTFAAFAYLTTDAAGDTFAQVSVIDADNGAVVVSPILLQAADAVTMASYGSIVLVFTMNAGSLDLYKFDATSFSTINIGWVSLGNLASDVDETANVQAVRVPAAAAVAIAYKNTSGGASPLTVRKVNEFGAVTSTTIAATAGQLTMAGMCEGGTVLWIAWNQNGTIRAASLNESTLAIVSAAANVLTGASPTSLYVAPRASRNAAVYASASTASYQVAIRNNSGTTATGGSPATLGAVRFVSRPFLHGTRIYGHVSSLDTTDMILCDVTPDTTSGGSLITYYRPVAAPIQRELFSISGFRTALVPGASKFLHFFSQKRSGTTVGAALAEYDFASPHRWKPASLNGSTWLSGGVLGVFDGTRWFEAAYLVKPMSVGTIDVSTAGSVTLAVGRSYVVTFGDIDADGNYHISGVSNPTTSDPCTDKQLELELRPLVITARGFTTSAIAVNTGAPSALRIQVWGTLDGGTTYYFVGEVANDPNDPVIDFVDDNTDAVLEGRPLLYGTGALPGTGGSSQDHRAPPGLTHIVAYNGMLVGSQGSSLFYSSQPIDGEGQWFSPVFVRSVDEEITGLAVQDGAVLIFTRTGIWVTSGEVPSDNALQGGLATPRRLAVDQGCTNANSIVVTAIGTFFQSTRGLELLTRGHALSPIGDKVQDTLAAFPVVTAAVLDTKHGLVRFSLAEDQADGEASTNGADLVFDLTMGGWVSTDEKRGSVDEQASQDAAMVYVDGAWRYAWFSSSGVVYFERAADDASAHTDGGTWIDFGYDLPPFKLGLQQEMRTYEMELLFERMSAAGIQVEIGNDYEAFGSETAKTWTESATSGKRQISFRPRANSDAIQLRIRDTAPATIGTGKGITFIGLSADVAPRQGATRGTPRLATSLRR